jgi:hypothetical protein
MWPLMGQLVDVTEKPSTRAGMVRFEINRSLTGMGHETFRSLADAVGPRPAAMLARKLFETSRVESVHIFGNIITVDLLKGFDSAGLDEVIRDMYQYWKPGVVPPAFEDLQPAGEVAAAEGAGDGATAELSEAAKRVPAELLERSRAARERWKAKTG